MLPLSQSWFKASSLNCIDYKNKTKMDCSCCHKLQRFWNRHLWMSQIYERTRPHSRASAQDGKGVSVSAHRLLKAGLALHQGSPRKVFEFLSRAGGGGAGGGGAVGVQMMWQEKIDPGNIKLRHMVVGSAAPDWIMTRTHISAQLQVFLSTSKKIPFQMYPFIILAPSVVFLSDTPRSS